MRSPLVCVPSAAADCGLVQSPAYSSVKPVYYSNAVIGLAGPNGRVEYAPAGVPLPRNGLLDVGGASLIANMTSLGLRQPSTVDAVVSRGGLPDYVSRMFPGPADAGQLPLVMIEETNADPAEVTRTLELVIAQAEKPCETCSNKPRCHQTRWLQRSSCRRRALQRRACPPVLV